MGEPLNPQLYRRLQRLFGTVRISNSGQAFRAHAVREKDESLRLSFKSKGEYYVVCCPYCQDRRFRLNINYMFGRADEHGRAMNFLAYCFNEDCLAKRENRDDLVEQLEDVSFSLREARINPGAAGTEDAREMAWPGECVRLDKLPERHPAVAYLRGRSFDPAVLGRKFAVSYCTQSRYFLARDRIIVPIFEYGKLKGWQARYVGELPWKDSAKKRDLPPKYFSCPESQFRSKCLLNFDQMKEWQTGIIVEGPTDVFRFGMMAGCIFGNTVTEIQRRKLVAVFRKRSLVLLLDPEEYESRTTQKFVKAMKTYMPRAFCAVKLPDGTDPGSLSREFLRNYVREAAAEKGVQVIYRKQEAAV